MAYSDPNAMSAVISGRNEDGTYTVILPITTSEEVYVDIDNDITLDEYLKSIVNFKTVNNDTERFALTAEDVKVMDIIHVIETNKKYFVIDLENLGIENGYFEIISKTDVILKSLLVTETETSEGVINSGKILVLNPEGKLPASITGDAASVGGITSDKLVTSENIATVLEENNIQLKTTVIKTTLLAGSWDSNRLQTINLTEVKANSDGTVGISETADDEQYNMACSARIRKILQGEGYLTFKYMDIEPTVDIPIEIHIY